MSDLTREEIMDLRDEVCPENGWVTAEMWRFHAVCDMALRSLDAPGMVPDGWCSVSAELPPEDEKVVLVLHADRPDYPVTAHFRYNETHLGLRVPTKGVAKHPWICWYSVGRNLCNPFDMASGPRGPFKDSAGYERFLPSYFGAGITHWKRLAAAPEAKEPNAAPQVSTKPEGSLPDQAVGPAVAAPDQRKCAKCSGTGMEPHPAVRGEYRPCSACNGKGR